MMERCGDFLYKLWFTRDDDLDTLQLQFACWSVYLMIVVAKVGSGAWTLPTAAWATISGFSATLAITAVPKWLAPIIAARKEAQIMEATYSDPYASLSGRVDNPDDL